MLPAPEVMVKVLEKRMAELATTSAPRSVAK